MDIVDEDSVTPAITINTPTQEIATELNMPRGRIDIIREAFLRCINAWNRSSKTDAALKPDLLHMLRLAKDKQTQDPKDAA